MVWAEEKDLNKNKTKQSKYRVPVNLLEDAFSLEALLEPQNLLLVTVSMITKMLFK